MTLVKSEEEKRNDMYRKPKHDTTTQATTRPTTAHHQAPKPIL